MVDASSSVKVVALLIWDPSQVKVYEVPETVVSCTPHGVPDGTFVAVYEECENDVIVPVFVPVFVPVLVTDPVLVPVPEAGFGTGNCVELPSTWICPLVALVGMAMVWPEVVNGGPPGVKVVDPATKLVGLPVNGMPSIVYVDTGAAIVVLELMLLLPDDPETVELVLLPVTEAESEAVSELDNEVVLLLTWVWPSVALDEVVELLVTEVWPPDALDEIVEPLIIEVRPSVALNDPVEAIAVPVWVLVPEPESVPL